jgi:hypothetical protein
MDVHIIIKQILETKVVTMLIRLILFGRSSMLNTSEHDDDSSGFTKTEFLESGKKKTMDRMVQSIM